MVDIEETIRKERFKNVTGSYARFTDVKGIGPAKANKIKNVGYSIETPSDVADYSADELSDKAGISRKLAAKVIKGGGGNPNVSKVGTQGTVSAAGMKKSQGDFMVGFSDIDKAKARNDARSRSKEAVRTDDRKRAPVTTELKKWKSNPSEYDFPGVDTPSQNPDLLPKDLKAGSPNTTDFEARDEREQEQREQEYGEKRKGGTVLQKGSDRLLAADVAEKIPDPEPFGPGVSKDDLEKEPMPKPFSRQAKQLGPKPSSKALPEPTFQNLARGDKADTLFTDAEKKRSKEVDKVDETHGAVMDFLEGGSQVEFKNRMREIQ